MHFANQTISFIVSGFLSMIWMVLLACPMDSIHNFRCLSGIVSYFFGKGGAEIFAPMLLFFAIAYALGSAMNALVNRLFGRMDKDIRLEVFRQLLTWEQLQVFEKEITNDHPSPPSEGGEPVQPDFELRADDYTKPLPYLPPEKFKKLSKKVDSVYHHLRYDIYSSKRELYDYLGFHRETIRILRASCFNIFLIFLSIFAICSYKPLAITSYAIVALFLANGILPNNPPLFDVFHSMFDGENRIRTILVFAFGYVLFLWEFPGENRFLFFAIPLCLGISMVCFLSWHKQQQDFYKTIINVQRTLRATQPKG